MSDPTDLAAPAAGHRPAVPGVGPPGAASPGAASDDSGATSVTSLPEDRFLNREVSWLEFNARVLALAEDPRTPLLERVKFLSIFARNLDEFYMVRIAGLKRRDQAGLPVRGLDRLPAREQLEVVAERSAALVTRHAHCFRDDVGPQLAAAEVQVVT